jgi:hypothetical protein
MVVAAGLALLSSGVAGKMIEGKKCLMTEDE